MNNITTAFFTLLVALGAIWLKDHLEQKKVNKVTLKQKAVEAYRLTGSLSYFLSKPRVYCQNLIKNIITISDPRFYSFYEEGLKDINKS